MTTSVVPFSAFLKFTFLFPFKVFIAFRFLRNKMCSVGLGNFISAIWSLICTAPQMIPHHKWSPDQKWSPNRTANDPICGRGSFAALYRSLRGSVQMLLMVELAVPNAILYRRNVFVRGKWVWTKRGLGHCLPYGLPNGLPYGLPYGLPVVDFLELVSALL